MIKSIQCIIIASYLFIATISLVSASSIKGQVFDAKTKMPLAAANVEIIGTTIGTAADDHGIFILRDLLPGQYKLKITRIGYKPSQAIVNLKPDETVALKIFLEPTVIEGKSITVTAKADANQAIARETPVSFRKLSIEELTDNYTTGDIPDLIQSVPGVWTSTAGIGESEMTIRGFGSDKIRVLVNDIPINNPEDNQVYWSTWAGLANAARSVEIHRGPGFLLYGANNFGGSLHIQTSGVTPLPETNFRVSTGIFNRMGIQSGPNAGMFYNPITDKYEKIANAINYTYSARFNTGSKYNGLLNASFFFEYKTGDSYIIGTNYDGFTLGLDAESSFGNHQLFFNFIVSPQAHNQAFVLQDIHLLEKLGREYNRKNHIWQENHYTKPFWALKHIWQISEKKVLNNNLFFSFGRGADQSLANDLFDVTTGKVDFQPCTRGGDAQAFGYHAQYLYNEFNLRTTDFIPAKGGNPSFFRGVEVYNVYAEGINFFSDQHTHSFQNRRRFDHWQIGLISYLNHQITDRMAVNYGVQGQLWRGHRISEAWFLQISNVTAQDRQLWAPLGIHNYTSKVQSIYDFDTRVDNFSLFGRMTWKPKANLTLQAGTQLIYTHSEVIENPIPLLDFGNWEFFDVAKRTTADLKGDRKFGWCNDYLRKHFYFVPWIGANYNVTATMNVFARYANSQREPSILDWYDFSRGPLFQKEFYPDNEEAQSLKPEIVNNFEIGTGYHTMKFDIDIDYYYSMFSDKIESVVDINDRHTTMNAGKATFQGIESEINYRFYNFDFSSSATFARNRWKKMKVKEIFGSDAESVAGKVVPFSPERMASLSLGYNLNSRQGNQARLGFRLNYWDEYYGTYTNDYAVYEKIIGPDNLPYEIPRYESAKLPHFLDVSAQLSYKISAQKVDMTFRIDANNILNRSDNFLRAQYAIDYTRNDKQAGKYNWYVLQAPLFNIFFTTEVAIH